MCRNDVFIDSVASVKERIKENNNIEYKDHLIHDVMKKDLGMRFRKVNGITF